MVIINDNSFTCDSFFELTYNFVHEKKNYSLLKEERLKNRRIWIFLTMKLNLEVLNKRFESCSETELIYFSLSFISSYQV